MKRINIFSLVLSILFLGTLSVSAQQSFVASVAAKDATYIRINPKDGIRNFLNTAGEQSFAVETNIALLTLSDATWCEAIVSEDGKEVTIKVQVNTENDKREAKVTIYGKDNNSSTIQVIQLGTRPNVLVNEQLIDVNQYAKTFTLSISSNTEFTFELPEWISAPSITPSIGFNEYEFTLSAITEENTKREGVVKIKATSGDVSVDIPVIQTHVGYPTFAVISDVHFGNKKGNYSPMEKVPQALKSLSSKKKLDALFIVGDLTDSGTEAQYAQFVEVLSNKENFVNPIDTMVYMMGNHDNFSSSAHSIYANGLKPLNNEKAYPMDQYLIIKGYPFITISQRGSSNTDANNESAGTSSYPKAVQDTLRSWLKRASEECPGKPIFLFTHVPLKHTAYSSWPNEGDGTTWPTWSMKVLNPIVNEYPQVITFGGHSHFPIGDPRSIHQGVNPNSTNKNYFTGINVGSSTYSEIHKPSVNIGIHPEQYENVTEGMILTVKPNGDVEIRRYDTFRDVEMDAENPWVVEAPHDGTKFKYADIRDKNDTNVNNVPLRDGLPAPVFKAEDAITLNDITLNSVMVTFPQATDNECVFRYSIKIKDQEGKTIKEFFKFSQFYLTVDMPKTLSVKMDGLKSNTTYTAEVVAYDSYENTSEPLVSQSFKTEDNNDPANQPPARTASWLFDDANDLLKASIGTATLVPGTETTSGGVTVVNSAADANIVSIAGPTAANKAITVPKLSLLKLVHGAASPVGTYTIMYDVRVKTTSTYHCLLQTALDNKGDGDFFINKSAQLGLSATGWGYGGSVSTNQWHRIVLVVKDGIPHAYLNGSSVSEGTGANDRWKLAAEATLLFADDSGEDDDIDVAEIAYWNQALTSGQIANLGSVE